jgi:hypothetical protein
LYNKTKAALVHTQRIQSKQNLQLGFDFSNRFTLVGPTFRANAVGNVIFTTGFANHQMIQGQRIVCAALVAARWSNVYVLAAPHRLYSSVNPISYEVR